MGGNLTLHPQKGVNPKLVSCTQCGGNTNEIVLLGARDFYTVCPSCEIHLIGGGSCPHCSTPGNKVMGTGRTALPEGMTLRAGLCDACVERNKQCKEMVEEGGVHWKCSDCGSAGAIKAHHPLAKDVRFAATKQGDIKPHKEGMPYEPCGIEFTKEVGCPACGPNAVDLRDVNNGRGV